LNKLKAKKGILVDDDSDKKPTYYDIKLL